MDTAEPAGPPGMSCKQPSARPSAGPDETAGGVFRLLQTVLLLHGATKHGDLPCPTRRANLL